MRCLALVADLAVRRVDASGACPELPEPPRVAVLPAVAAPTTFDSGRPRACRATHLSLPPLDHRVGEPVRLRNESVLDDCLLIGEYVYVDLVESSNQSGESRLGEAVTH